MPGAPGLVSTYWRSFDRIVSDRGRRCAGRFRRITGAREGLTQLVRALKDHENALATVTPRRRPHSDHQPAPRVSTTSGTSPATVPAVDSTTDALFERALIAQASAAGDREDLSALVKLHEMATEAVFTRALALVDSPDWPNRRLGLRVLKEIGQGRRPRPFHQRTIDALLPRVASCESLVELRALVSTLGWQNDARVLPTLLALADHPDRGVRFHVASNLPGCACRDSTIDERAVPPLLQLMTDPDTDVRYYATAAFEVDYPAVESPAIRSALEERLSDEDESIRLCARRALDVRRRTTTISP